MLPRSLSALLLSLYLAGCASGGGTPDTALQPPVGSSAQRLQQAAEAQITAAVLGEDIAFLSSDALLGRDTPSAGLEVAASYLVDHFSSLGLTPAGDPGSFRQLWPFQRLVHLNDESIAEARGPGIEQRWVYGVDYFVIPSPPVPVEGAPYFAPSPTQISQELPRGAQGRPLVVPLPYGLGPDFSLVIQAAVTVGASSLVLILDEETGADIGEIAGALEAGAAGQLPLAVYGVRLELGEALLASAGIDVRGGRDPPAILDGIELSLLSEWALEEHEVSNVAALLPGSDPLLRDSYVILTAHYDHVGVGAPDAQGDSIFNGADDNASGTAVLMRVASALASLPEAPARSVLFLAVSGEEQGLLGSAYYAAFPTVPETSIVANINMDMIGRNHPDTLFAIGEDYTTLGALAHRIVADRPELGLLLAPDPAPEEQIFLRSDHYSFVELGIPALMFTTGLHEDYHAPSDHAERIDADKAARIGRLIFYLTHAVADDPTPPEWTPLGSDLLRRILF